MNLKIDTSGLGGSQSALDIKSVVDAALSDPAKKPVFDSILADPEPAINSVKFNTSNKFTWSSAISPNGDLIISVNPNSDVNKFDADSLLHHELTHHTAAMNAMSSAAVDAFIKTAPESWRSLSVKYGAAAESVLNYGFEEFFNQISNNQYRLKYGLKPVASIGAGTQGAFSFADFSSMVEIAKANPAEFKATILDYINEYVKQNSLKGGALEDFLSAMNAETSGVSYRANGAVDYWRSPDGSIGQTRPGSHYSKEFLDFYGKVNPTTGVASAGFGATLAALADQLGLDGEFGIQGTFASSSFQVPHARASVGSALNAVGVAAGNVLGAIFDPIAKALDAIFHPNGVRTPKPEPTKDYSASDKNFKAADKNGDGRVEGRERDDFRAREEDRFDRQREENKASRDGPDRGGDKGGHDRSDKGDRGDKGRDRPILLDLDGNGVKIDDLSRSTTFIDAGGDGLKHRTAWAGAGDGVLFFDADGDGALSQKREYVFTEWGERRRRNGPVDRFRQRTRGCAGLDGQFRHGGAEGLFRHERRRQADSGGCQFREVPADGDECGRVDDGEDPRPAWHHRDYPDRGCDADRGSGRVYDRGAGGFQEMC